MVAGILSLLLGIAGAASSGSQKIVGYYPSWGIYQGFTWKQIDYSQVTHVAWSFAMVDSLTGAMIGPEEQKESDDLDSLVKAAHARGVKVLVSLGGATGSSAFPPMARVAAKRERFCREVTEFVRSRNLDGADMDWEWSGTPLAADTAAYPLLLNQLRDSLGSSRILSAALPASDWGGRWFDIPRIVDALDWIGVMTYDMTGDWDEYSGYNSPLFVNPRKVGSHAVADWSVASSMDYWNRKRGVPKSKLLIGQPSYGFVFSGATAPGATYSGTATYSAYRSIVAALPTWARHWDDTAKANWATTPGGEYVTWDDPRTAAMKARWAKENGYAGAIVWELSQDYSAASGHPIMDSLSRILLGDPVSVASRGASADGIRWVGNNVVAELAGDEVGILEIVDLRGRVLRATRGRGPVLRTSLDGIRPGVVVVRATSGVLGARSRRILVQTPD